MSEQAVPQPVPNEEDVNTTPPNPQMTAGKGAWTMPEPVFRKTSGYLPQGYEKRFSQDEIRSTADDNDSTAEMPAPELGAAAIEPQPEISEISEAAFTADQAQAAAVPVKRSAAKFIFIVLGLILALGLVVLLAAAVYLYYLMPNPDATF